MVPETSCLARNASFDSPIGLPVRPVLLLIGEETNLAPSSRI